MNGLLTAPFWPPSLPLPQRLSVGCGLLLALLAGHANAQQPDKMVSGVSVTARLDSRNQCQGKVLEFERAIGFVRQTAGGQLTSSVKERLLPAKLEQDILMKDGYCGLADYLRSRKLIK
ncbi:MAG: hypothetical protein JWR60_3229 [Polaromonas sp.]|nr:hypothetical protein [Polaromonas sp.]